jgi:hypothetical protein
MRLPFKSRKVIRFRQHGGRWLDPPDLAITMAVWPKDRLARPAVTGRG